jgi:hypothetical protein
MTSPFNLHSLLRNYLKLFGEDSCVLIHFITFTKSFLNTQNPGTCQSIDYIIQVNVYHYIRQVGSMESIKILFSSTDIWVMDYTVTGKVLLGQCSGGGGGWCSCEGV